MAKNLLVEIGLEEMPAHVVTPSIEQFEKKVITFLTEHNVTFGAVKSFSTPRRLALHIADMAEKQADLKEEVKGPAKKIAQDKEGNWSKAAQGFVRGQGLTTADITFKELKGVEYVYVTKETLGKATTEVLAGLKEVIMSLTFPTMMHWANTDFEYIRPIKWLVALFGTTTIDFSILDVKTATTSRGHRFLGETVTFANADEYEEKLAGQFVVADAKKRETLIVEQVQQIAKTNNWLIDLDADLLEEVNNLVEYPTVFVGNFDAKYLDVPEEVLITSMKEHQRYFYVRNQAGELLPHFIGIRNGNAEHLENVRKGNEKVLVARLDDGEFFYQEDQKMTIEQYVEKLKNVTFHEKIGSIYEKMQRVGAIAAIIGREVGLTTAELADLQRASEIYKFDLVTNMVGEFPELQGIMGERYALLAGENAATAKAIREHYMPISAEGDLPESNVGAVLAIADKLDSLLAFFAVDMIPNGSNDPYALRRQTYGIVRIIENKRWGFPLLDLQAEVAEVINSDDKFGVQFDKEQDAVIDFVKARVRQNLLTKGVRHDVIDAVIAADQKDLTKLFGSAKILKTHLNDDEFKPSIEALTRVIHLAEKAESTELSVDADLFENEAEQALFEAVKALEEKVEDQTMAENFESLVALRPLIESYFDETMVMAEDEAVRNNRLNQLAKIAVIAKSLASLDQLVTK
jgi:glycyl-tRNA synthetase beta chain